MEELSSIRVIAYSRSKKMRDRAHVSCPYESFKATKAMEPGAVEEAMELLAANGLTSENIENIVEFTIRLGEVG